MGAISPQYSHEPAGDGAPVATPASARKLTSLGDQIDGWAVGSREMISWKSTDGTAIEGVLHKPADFQPGRKYPLLVNIHGGPTAISRPYRVAGAGPYPIEQWLGKGAIILEPNYRGSAGFGEKFRSLNVRNLGVGDAWDVLSGVDYLIDAMSKDSETPRSQDMQEGVDALCTFALLHCGQSFGHFPGTHMGNGRQIAFPVGPHRVCRWRSEDLAGSPPFWRFESSVLLWHGKAYFFTGVGKPREKQFQHLKNKGEHRNLVLAARSRDHCAVIRRSIRLVHLHVQRAVDVNDPGAIPDAHSQTYEFPFRLG